MRPSNSAYRLALTLVIALAMVPDVQAEGKSLPSQAPAAAILISPEGDLGTNYNPAYTWNKGADATWYYLWVGGSSGNVFKQWYDASLVCGASTCSATPAKTLAGGTYIWYIQTYNSAGYGPWSAGMTFNTAPLGAANLVSPAGSISDYTPEYTWNEVGGATYYYLYVNGPSGNVIKTWYQASVFCSGGICSVSPENALKGGAHTWWVRTWNSAGYGSWSDSMNFDLPIPKKPLATTLISPSGGITDTTPTYSWREVVDSPEGDAATWYYLWVKDTTGAAIKRWYEASVICAGGTCSVTPATPVTAGPVTWWVQTYNTGGYGPWSGGMNFSIPVPWPQKPTLISPSGTITGSTPTYIWNAVSSETGDPATWYQLSVSGSGGIVFSQWYTAVNTGCSSGSGTCSIMPSISLTAGNAYTWQVRGYNAAGTGPWSSSMSFSLAATSNCSPAYPGVCIPPPPPDLNCGDISYRNFTVLPPDPHGFDGDHDGIGCEE